MKFEIFLYLAIYILTLVNGELFTLDNKGDLININKRSTDSITLNVHSDGQIEFDIPTSLGPWTQIYIDQYDLLATFAWEVSPGSTYELCNDDGTCVAASGQIENDDTLFSAAAGWYGYDNSYDYVKFLSPKVQYPSSGTFSASFEIMIYLENGQYDYLTFNNFPVVLVDNADDYIWVATTTCYQDSNCATTSIPHSIVYETTEINGVEQTITTYSSLSYGTVSVPTMETIYATVIGDTVTTVTTICPLTESFTPSTYTQTTYYTDCYGSSVPLTCVVADTAATVGAVTATFTSTSCAAPLTTSVTMVKETTLTTINGVDVTSSFTITNYITPSFTCPTFTLSTTTVTSSYTNCDNVAVSATCVVEDGAFTVGESVVTLTSTSCSASDTVTGSFVDVPSTTTISNGDSTTTVTIHNYVSPSFTCLTSSSKPLSSSSRTPFSSTISVFTPTTQTLTIPMTECRTTPISAICVIEDADLTIGTVVITLTSTSCTLSGSMPGSFINVPSTTTVTEGSIDTTITIPNYIWPSFICEPSTTYSSGSSLSYPSTSPSFIPPMTSSSVTSTSITSSSIAPVVITSTPSFTLPSSSSYIPPMTSSSTVTSMSTVTSSVSSIVTSSSVSSDTQSPTPPLISSSATPVPSLSVTSSASITSSSALPITPKSSWSESHSSTILSTSQIWTSAPFIHTITITTVTNITCTLEKCHPTTLTTGITVVTTFVGSTYTTYTTFCPITSESITPSSQSITSTVSTISLETETVASGPTVLTPAIDSSTLSTVTPSTFTQTDTSSSFAEFFNAGTQVHGSLFSLFCILLSFII